VFDFIIINVPTFMQLTNERWQTGKCWYLSK